MNDLAAVSQLVIHQKKEWTEILAGFEGKNRYTVLDSFGNELYSAVETGGSLLARWFLRAWRPFTIEILDRVGQRLLRVERPFRFYYHEASIEDANGRRLGTLRRELSLLRRIYHVDTAESAGGAHGSFSLYGPLLKPWTFEIRRGGVAVGTIRKKWSGLLKESFSDADNFGIEFDPSFTTDEKALFLGALFLIDFVHFENSGN